MYLVDVEDGVALGCQTLHHHLHALLEVASELCASHHRGHVHHIDTRTLQTFWHLAALNHRRQSVDESRLAHARFADVQRIVLVLATEHANGALQLVLSSDERIVRSVRVVEAGHEAAPLLGLHVVAFFIAVLRHVHEAHARHLVAADEERHESRLVVAYSEVQAVSRQRLLQLHHGGDDMRDVQLVAFRELRLLHGMRHHLAELLRTFYGVRDTLRHLLHLRQLRAQLLLNGPCVQLGSGGSLHERFLLGDGVKHMLRRDKLMSPLVAERNGVLKSF